MPRKQAKRIITILLFAPFVVSCCCCSFLLLFKDRIIFNNRKSLAIECLCGRWSKGELKIEIEKDKKKKPYLFLYLNQKT